MGSVLTVRSPLSLSSPDISNRPIGRHSTKHLNIDYLQLKGARGTIFAVGDCTATSYAPTAQVASQQGAYLGRVFNLISKQEEMKEQSAVLAEAIRDVDMKIAATAPVSASSSTTTETATPLKGEKATLVAEKRRVDRSLARTKIMPFHYSHQGSLAYIGSEKAIADLPFMNGNVSTPPLPRTDLNI